MNLKNPKVLFILILSILTVTIKIVIYYYNYSFLKFTFFDIDQGDSSLVTLNNYNFLVDGGDFYELDSYIATTYIYNLCHIDSVFISHLHSDHIVGILRLLEWCVVDDLYFGYFDSTNKFANQFSSKAIEKNIKLHFMSAGDSLKFKNLNLYILWPPKDFILDSTKNLNNSSLVLLIDYNNFEVLYTGDSEEASLKKIYDLNKDLLIDKVQNGLDILKVSHHGSRTGVYKPLYTFLNPKFCVISVGKNNKYSHPHSEAIGFYESIGCKILRTDQMGTIDFKVKVNDANMPIIIN